ncbi:MAG: hypothetical protein ABR573_06105 [Candidatus Dormibacteria bacterium]
MDNPDPGLPRPPGPVEAAAVAAGTGVAMALGTRQGWRHWVLIYRHHMPRNARRERLFLAALAFGLTFGLVRLLTHAIRANIGPFHNVSVGGRHLHHLVWGILLLLTVGYANIVQYGGSGWRAGIEIRVTSILFGIGAALTLDEFALWLNLKDVYWQSEGRQSIDAVLLFGSLLVVGISAQPLLHAAAWEIQAIIRGVSRAERIAHLEYVRLRRLESTREAPQQPVDGPA